MYGNYIYIFYPNSQYDPLSFLLFYAGQCFYTKIYDKWI